MTLFCAGLAHRYRAERSGYSPPLGPTPSGGTTDTSSWYRRKQSATEGPRHPESNLLSLLAKSVKYGGVGPAEVLKA